MGLMTPLVDQLQQFCLGHEQWDGGTAAAEMLAYLQHDWAGIPQVSVEADPGDDRRAEELALGVVRNVGEVAAILLATDDSDERLGWARANLIGDLERYLTAVGSPR
jgi:hypothetical protein